jgi:hypothetical protein
MAEGRGRPPKPATEKTAAHAGVRLTTPLYEQLAAAAQAASRTLSEEIEFRLRRSFEGPDQQLKDRFGGETTYWLFLIAGNLVRHLESFTGERWWRDAYTHRQMKILITAMLDCFKPAGRTRTPSDFANIGKPLGQHLAERELANVEATLLTSKSDEPIGWNWGGMGVTEWRRAAERFAGKLTQSPLAKLYGIERTKK